MTFGTRHKKGAGNAALRACCVYINTPRETTIIMSASRYIKYNNAASVLFS